VRFRAASVCAVRHPGAVNFSQSPPIDERSGFQAYPARWQACQPTEKHSCNVDSPSRRTAAVALTTLSALPAYAVEDTKVGILHSLSGTMAISETVLKRHRLDGD
jgi:hypothetical protein